MTVASLMENTPIPVAAEKIIALGEAVYDCVPRVLYINGEERVLEPRIGDLLSRLIDAGGPVCRDRLLDDIWGHNGSDEALTQAISKLRRALSDTDRPYRIMETVPKLGYRLGVAPAIGRRPEGERLEIAVVEQPAHLREPGFFARNLVFLQGIAAGVGLCVVGAAIHLILSPPKTLEREIVCSDGANPDACADLFE